MFQAPMQGQNNQITGQLLVDASSNNGAGTLTLKGAPANASLILQFCPFNPDTYGKGGAPCYTVTNVMTDAAGDSNTTFQYPKSGVFFGTFRLMQGTAAIAIDGFTYTTTPDYHTSIQRASTVNDVNWSTFTLGDDQITTGSLNIHGSIMTVSVTGTIPNSIYDLTLCPGMTGSGCYDAGTFKTDATGAANASIDLKTTAAGFYTPSGETFYFTRGNALQYIAGFKVQ